MENVIWVVLKWIFCVVFRARWIVSLGEDSGELGLRIMGVNLWYYKWEDPMIAYNRPWRFATKREFGEVVRSAKIGRASS